MEEWFDWGLQIVNLGFNDQKQFPVMAQAAGSIIQSWFNQSSVFVAKCFPWERILGNCMVIKPLVAEQSTPSIYDEW